MLSNGCGVVHNDAMDDDAGDDDDDDGDMMKAPGPKQRARDFLPLGWGLLRWLLVFWISSEKFYEPWPGQYSCSRQRHWS